jgi:hypothetical protein
MSNWKYGYATLLRFGYATLRSAFHGFVSLLAYGPGIAEVLSLVTQKTSACKLTNPGSSHAQLRSHILTPLLALIVLSGLAFSATPAMAEFHLTNFAIGAQNENGTPDVQAGSHPYSLTNTFVLEANSGDPKDAQVELPPGFVGDPNATPKCSYPDFIAQEEAKFLCSNSSAVGVSTVYSYLAGEPERATPYTQAVYNLVPPNGVAAEFGFVVGGKTPVLIRFSARTGGDYGLTATAPNVNQVLLVLATTVTIWGVPANPAHNLIRGECESHVLGVERPVEQEGTGLREDELGLELPIHER